MDQSSLFMALLDLSEALDRVLMFHFKDHDPDDHSDEETALLEDIPTEMPEIYPFLRDFTQKLGRTPIIDYDDTKDDNMLENLTNITRITCLGFENEIMASQTRDARQTNAYILAHGFRQKATETREISKNTCAKLIDLHLRNDIRIMPEVGYDTIDSVDFMVVDLYLASYHGMSICLCNAVLYFSENVYIGSLPGDKYFAQRISAIQIPDIEQRLLETDNPDSESTIDDPFHIETFFLPYLRDFIQWYGAPISYDDKKDENILANLTNIIQLTCPGFENEIMARKYSGAQETISRTLANGFRNKATGTKTISKDTCVKLIELHLFNSIRKKPEVNKSDIIDSVSFMVVDLYLASYRGESVCLCNAVLSFSEKVYTGDRGKEYFAQRFSAIQIPDLEQHLLDNDNPDSGSTIDNPFHIDEIDETDDRYSDSE
jgi:hypothetical protein